MRNLLLSTLLLASAFQTAMGQTTVGAWTYIVENGGATIKASTATGAVTIPSVLNGVPVRKVGDDRSGPIFGYPNLSVTSITIPNSVTSIGGGAFRQCDNLASITIPNSVTSILDGAFMECDNLASITIPNSVTSIGPYAFELCHRLSSITIPNSVTSIGEGAFSTCLALTSITMGSGVTSIGAYVFGDCRGLKTVTIGSRVTSIGNDAFYNCNSLTSITIPNSVINIAAGAFADCYSVTNVFVGAGVNYLGNGAFDGMTNLQSIRFSGNAPNYVGDPFSENSYTTPSFTLYYSQGTTGWGSTFAGRQTTMISNFSLTLASDLNKGSVANSPSGNSFSSGTSISLSAIPLAGYVFTAWSGDFTSTDNPLVLVMNGNKAVTANFDPDNRDIDGDGLSNYQEVFVFKTNPNQAEISSPVAGLYLASEKQAERINGRNDVIASPNAYGFYTTSQIQNMAIGDLVLTKNPNGSFTLNYDIEQSTDLQNWTPYQALSLPLTGLPTDKAFIRIKAKQ